MRTARESAPGVRLRRRRGRIADINVVPYVDVLLVLLSIFALLATLMQRGIDVHLPRALAPPLQHPAVPIVVSIDAFGNLYLSTFRRRDEALDEDFVIRAVKRRLVRDPLRPVLVHADAKVRYGTVLRMMVLLREAGARDVGLLARDARG